MKTLHLMTTSLCDRDCPHCCNKQMNLNRVKYVSNDDFMKCDAVCITGGEPILYSNVNEIAKKIKTHYPHIKRVYVYANAFEMLRGLDKTDFIDGFSVSIKCRHDAFAFRALKNDPRVSTLKSNKLYVFDRLIKEDDIPSGWEYVERKWQERFKPAKNCIFRKI